MKCYIRGCQGCQYCEDEDFSHERQHKDGDEQSFYGNERRNEAPKRSKKNKR